MKDPAIVRRWRNRWEDTPRTADYGMQVLSAVLSYAVDPLGKIASNPCEGIKVLYSGDRSEHLGRREHHRAEAPEAAQEGVSIGADAIVMTTGKSRHRREVIIPSRR